jgi:hypothetical protein
MTWKEGKIPDNFYCADADKIVKIKVKDGETATQVHEPSRPVFPIAGSDAVAKEDAVFVSGNGTLRMVRRVFRHLWPGERAPAEENEDNDRGGMDTRQG